ncbi:MAG TPA: hypothetical protein VHF51_15265 [Solirubrobacteraceae bacterium]|nr:hypothetical protein [Solirubrobacteraceae bacterium]
MYRRVGVQPARAKAARSVAPTVIASVGERAVREAERAVAGARERGVAVTVALERTAAATVAPAVGLDAQPGGVEDEVDLEAGRRGG